MTRTYANQLILLAKRLSICFLIYFLCRLGFYIAQLSYFENTSWYEFLALEFYGLRFDAFSVTVASALFILLSLLPVNAFFSKTYQRLLYWVYFLPNAVFIAFNCIDVVYFEFTHKRSDADIFNQLGGQSDMLKLIPRFFLDFWWGVLFYVLLLVLMRYLYRRIRLRENRVYALHWSRSWWSIALFFILTTGVFVVAVRGGLQRVPISIVNAGDVATPGEIPLLVNTPFTIIKSSGDNPLEELKFYNPQELLQVHSPYHHFDSLQPNKKNLIVLILESFSKEYTKLSGKKSHTPFLDSLMDHSLLFSNGFSNGTKSIEGIPAILSGIPSFMDMPYINSRYASNSQSSLANLLNKEGYQTAFFHGGINGTMNFDSWANLAGYQNYYGKNEYPNEGDFDNFWGIWDEPYLKFCVDKMNTFKEPFHSAIFTLSSHHPYFVPDKYKNKFPKSELENSESIGYADYALRGFFEKAKHEKWYKNSIFVLVADHTSLSIDPFYIDAGGFLSIPILFYSPDNSLAQVYPHVFSQIDILPSSLQLLGYNKPFFSFGEPYSKRENRAAYFYNNHYYYQYTDSLLFIYHNYSPFRSFNIKTDSLIKRNILNEFPKLDSLNFLFFKTFVQTYNNALIKDSANVPNRLPYRH